MNWIHIELLTIVSLTALAATISGIFMVLRGTALMSDAISHSVLPGIVILFLIVQNLESPLLFLGASLSGLATVLITELLIQTKQVKSDAAIGLVFPLFFSIGVLLITLCARNTHLDTDMVLLGELAFAPFSRFILYGIDLGPTAIWSMGGILLIVSTFLLLVHKEITMATFDPIFAQINGFAPRQIYYAMMLLASITIVGALTIVGSVIIITLMIVPTATAQLLTKKLSHLTLLSILFSLFSSVYGYLLAYVLDASIAGSIALVGGILFIIVLICTNIR